MNKRNAFIAVLAVGMTVVVPPAAGFAQQPTAPDATATVQLNADTAVSHGLVNNYVADDFNVALGQCVTPGSANAPASTAFSSPVLTFTNYAFEPTLGVAANVSADAQLKPGTKPGHYPLTMMCNGKPYSATFTVPKPAEKQVTKVPVGAARAGDGSTAK